MRTTLSNGESQDAITDPRRTYRLHISGSFDSQTLTISAKDSATSNSNTIDTKTAGFDGRFYPTSDRTTFAMSGTTGAAAVLIELTQEAL